MCQLVPYLEFIFEKVCGIYVTYVYYIGFCTTNSVNCCKRSKIVNLQRASARARTRARPYGIGRAHRCTHRASRSLAGCPEPGSIILLIYNINRNASFYTYMELEAAFMELEPIDVAPIAEPIEEEPAALKNTIVYLLW